MDVLANTSIDTFKTLVWVAAIIVGALLALNYPHKRTRQTIGLVLKSTLGAAITFFIANLGVVFYVLAHSTDPRWSVGKDEALDPPELSADVPFFDSIVMALNQFIGNVAGGVNDLIVIKNAFLSTTDFLTMAAWALVAIVALGVPVWIMGIFDERWRQRQLDAVIDVKDAYVADLADIRRKTGLPPFDPKN